MQINHNIATKKAWTEKDGRSAYVEYEIIGGTLDIKHTIVPIQLEGQGIASQLVKYMYDYALQQGLTPSATCPYAQAWLRRHPQYETK